MIFLDWDGLMTAMCPDCSALLYLAEAKLITGNKVDSDHYRQLCPDDLSLLSMHVVAKIRQAREDA